MEKFFIENLESLWADLTQSEIDAIPDTKVRSKYKRRVGEYDPIINKFSTLVPRSFKFSVPKDKLTCRIMLQDYMNYFYSKGMTREQIIVMLSGSPINNLEEGKKK